MSVPTPQRYTITEYLELERQSQEKHEYREGEIVTVLGATPEHALITANVIGELRQRLRTKPCRVFDSSLRIRIPRTPLYAYPDVVVVCGTPQFDPQDPSGQSLTNPRVIVVVLSPSTEAYDRGLKSYRYREAESLEEYVLVSQDRPLVETFFRQADGTWALRSFFGLEAIARLRCLEIDLPLREVYAGISFPPEAEEKPGGPGRDGR